MSIRAGNLNCSIQREHRRRGVDTFSPEIPAKWAWKSRDVGPRTIPHRPPAAPSTCSDSGASAARHAVRRPKVKSIGWTARMNSTNVLPAKRIAVVILAAWIGALLLPSARRPSTSRRPSQSRPGLTTPVPRWLPAQSAETVIDGATNPNGILDDRVQSVVLLTAAASPTEPSVARARAASAIGKLRLKPADAVALSRVANQYKDAFAQFVSAPSTGDEATYEQNRTNLLRNAMSQLEGAMTPMGSRSSSPTLRARKAGSSSSHCQT